MPDHFPDNRPFRTLQKPMPAGYHEPDKGPDGPNWTLIVGVSAFIIAAAVAFAWSVF